MKFWTWTEIKTKIETENDLAEETFISGQELMDWANDAIDVAENQILTLQEDYFLAKGALTLVNGTDAYALPAAIFAHKIRGLVYNNGSTFYEIKRVQDWRKFLEYRSQRFSGTNARYQYFIDNTTAGTPKILLSPPAYEAGQFVEIWFIRNANRLTTGTDVCDIPEFVSFIFAYLTERIWWKAAAGSARHMKAAQDVETVKEDMIETLANMVPDNENTIPPDFSWYEGMS